MHPLSEDQCLEKYFNDILNRVKLRIRCSHIEHGPIHVCSFDSLEVRFKCQGSEFGKQFLNCALLSNVFTVLNKICVENMCICLPYLTEELFVDA